MSTNVRKLEGGWALLYRDDLSGIAIVPDEWLKANNKERQSMHIIEISRELIMEMVLYYIKRKRMAMAEKRISELTFDDICKDG